MKWLKAGLRALFLRLEQVCEKFFGPGLNPLVHLGSLGWFLFWIVTVTGIYIYVFFDTGVTQAYASLEYLSREQWYLGGIMRSLHRYASDAMVVVVVEPAGIFTCLTVTAGLPSASSSWLSRSGS